MQSKYIWEPEGEICLNGNSSFEEFVALLWVHQYNTNGNPEESQSQRKKFTLRVYGFCRELGKDGTTCIREYLEERRKQVEELTHESLLLQFDVRGVKKNTFLRTTFVTRDITEAIEQVGLKMRLYVLRAYFSTALDIA